jgi:predicted KAP-like P-loop ATPase
MWPDNEADRDFLNFTGVADTVGEIIVQASGRPISVGISGAWGVGKSSMIKLVRRSLMQRTGIGTGDFVFVEFNAWLYQGYDDARAALMDVIGAALTVEAEERKKGIDKAKEFVDRIQWFRVAKLVLGSAVAIHAGLPPVGLIGDLVGVGKKLFGGEVDAESIGNAEKAVGDGKTDDAVGVSKKLLSKIGLSVEEIPLKLDR